MKYDPGLQKSLPPGQHNKPADRGLESGPIEAQPVCFPAWLHEVQAVKLSERILPQALASGPGHFTVTSYLEFCLSHVSILNSLVRSRPETQRGRRGRQALGHEVQRIQALGPELSSTFSQGCWFLMISGSDHCSIVGDLAG